MGEPFTRAKAAEYFVVAWVKDWRMQTYLEAIGAGGLDVEKVHQLYPWMPPPKNKFYFEKKKSPLIRGYAARVMRAINDQLWDAKTVPERLAIAKKIEQFAVDIDMQKLTRASEREDKHDRRSDKRERQASKLSYDVSVELMRRGGGSHWNVVK